MPGFENRQKAREKKHIVSKKHKPGDQHLNLSKSAEEKARTDQRHRKMKEKLQKV